MRDEDPDKHAMNNRDTSWLAVVCSITTFAFIAGMLIGVHWYDTKYRPEINQYLKDCHR